MAKKRGGLFFGTPSVMTRSAPPRWCATLCFYGNRIALIKRMSLSAVRLYTVVQASIPAPNIFLLRDGFKMARVKTCSVPA